MKWLGACLLALGVAAAGSALGQKAAEPERVRGTVARVDASSMVIQLKDGNSVRVALAQNLAVFSLSRGSFADLDFGTYVGSVSERMGDTYSPIYRDSLSWLHRGIELRIIDESLRGIAVGHTKWDLTKESVITHGWVDDIEERVISIKYGPTDQEETDVEIGRDIPVLKMSLGDRSLLKPGAHVVAGVHKGPDAAVAVFVFVGKEGVVPPL
ncbi:MAG TPA: hypothetical protein VLI89_05570 [Burkholderiales bacterium]|nr:hypothetical protein [Burkholderiales bacterium]